MARTDPAADPSADPAGGAHIATADDPVPDGGRRVRTGSGTAAWNRRGAGEIGRTIPHHLVLFSFTPYANRETRLGGTRIRSVSRASGMCEIVPAGADYWARWHEPKEVAVFALCEAWLGRLAERDLDMPGATLRADALPIADRRVAMLGGLLREELRGDDYALMPALQLDSLLNLLGVHLLRAYGGARPQRDAAGLTDRQFRRVRDHLAAHLADTVTLDHMAGVAGLSSSQLLRAFRRRTGTSPHQYLTRMRLDRARALILGGPMPLAQVALACGFSSQSHLTHAMRRADGLTPGALRA